MISLLVRVSDSAFPSLLGSISLFKAACYAFWDIFCCSRSLASSASVLDLTAYLYNLIIRIRRISLNDLIILVNLSEPPLTLASSPGNTSADRFELLKPINSSLALAIQSISGIRLTVAIISSQKKKLYLNSSTTHELTNISSIKRNRETIRHTKKYGSASLVKNQSLKSSPNRANKVTRDIIKMTHLPSTISLIRDLIG
mmetsp:Transcript_92831/g.127977  ORF Transcript_92831/g.127977 Transcript_92831/m.127977 type:complete len:200 (-) Transcript_92831:63-662(-)